MGLEKENEGKTYVVVVQLRKCVVSHEISFQFSLIVQIQQDCNRSHHIATDRTTF